MRTTRTKTTTEPRGPAPAAASQDLAALDLAEQVPPRQWSFALGLGANLPQGERSAASTLQQAIHALAAHLGPLRTASLYRSAPILQDSSRHEPGDPPPSEPPLQPDYFNTAACGTTALPPDGLLALAKALERAAGRGELGVLQRDAPRPLDIDLLLYGDMVLDRPELTLPHPRLHWRRFVLEPLAELLPNRPLPPDGRTATDLLLDVMDQRVERCPWPSTPS